MVMSPSQYGLLTITMISVRSSPGLAEHEEVDEYLLQSEQISSSDRSANFTSPTATAAANADAPRE